MDLVKDYLMSSACRVFQGVTHQFVATAERINCVQMESQSPVHSIQSVQQCLCAWWRYRKNVNRCCSLPFEQLSTRRSNSERTQQDESYCSCHSLFLGAPLTSKRTVLNMGAQGRLQFVLTDSVMLGVLNQIQSRDGIPFVVMCLYTAGCWVRCFCGLMAIRNFKEASFTYLQHFSGESQDNISKCVPCRCLHGATLVHSWHLKFHGTSDFLKCYT